MFAGWTNVMARASFFLGFLLTAVVSVGFPGRFTRYISNFALETLRILFNGRNKLGLYWAKLSSNLNSNFVILHSRVTV